MLRIEPWAEEAVAELDAMTPEAEVLKLFGVSERALRRWRQLSGAKVVSGGRGVRLYPRASIAKLMTWRAKR